MIATSARIDRGRRRGRRRQPSAAVNTCRVAAGGEIVLHHRCHERAKRGGGRPSQLVAGPGGVTDQTVQVGGAEKPGIADHVVPPFQPRVGEGDLADLLHAVQLAGCDHEVARFVLLEHQVHGAT